MVPIRSDEPNPNLLPASAPVAVQPSQPALPDASVERKPRADDQEVDVWWGSYSGRTMIPTFVVCTLLSASIALIAVWLWDEHWAHPQLMWHMTVLLIVLVWLFPLFVCGYRTVALNYRLTTQRLFRDRGFGHPPADGEMELARITAVRVRYTGLGRWISVGGVCVDADCPSCLVLQGIHEPERVADLIRGCAQRARERNGDTRTV
jgi:hypothetical protein